MSNVRRKKNVLLYSGLPFMLSAGLVAVAVLVWPSEDNFALPFLKWLNIILLFGLALTACIYGIYRLKTKNAILVGSRLRTKLVAAMVLMVLVPSLLLQITANQIIEKGMDVWFDVRVDTLLEKAMSLAQGLYASAESDVELSLAQVARDDDFPLDVTATPFGTMVVSKHLSTLLLQHGWDKVELFDMNERVIAVAQRDVGGQNFDDLRTQTLSKTGKLSIALGRQIVEHEIRGDSEYVIGFLPLYRQQRLTALLRAEVQLPDNITESARSIEEDYRTYRELDRHRQGIQDVFLHTLMIAMILIACMAGFVALFFSRRLTIPIEDLAVALKKVEAGDLDVLVPASSGDELASLGASFNSMAARLKQNMAALTQTEQQLTSALVSSRQRQYVLENLLANLQSGVILLDDHGNIRLMNQACKDLFALPDKEDVKTSIFDFSEVQLRPVLEFFRALQTQGLDSLQEELELAYGLQVIKVLARGMLLAQQEDTSFSGWLLVFDDVTKLADAQKHQAWSEVAQRLAHEIKNPLTPIKLSTERVQRRFRDQVDDVKVFDMCTDSVIRQVERLQRLLADFSNLATLPQPKKEAVSIASLLQDMRDLYSPYKNLVFEGMPDSDVFCDADQIRQVLINLIDNALATKTLVKLFVEITEKGTSFYVQDEGAGIDEQTQKHMFEPYFSTKKDGSGLGLAIAQRITEEHGGSLQLVSATSPTRFCMWLPYVCTNDFKVEDKT